MHLFDTFESDILFFVRFISLFSQQLCVRYSTTAIASVIQAFLVGYICFRFTLDRLAENVSESLAHKVFAKPDNASTDYKQILISTMNKSVQVSPLKWTPSKEAV